MFLNFLFANCKLPVVMTCTHWKSIHSTFQFCLEKRHRSQTRDCKELISLNIEESLDFLKTALKLENTHLNKFSQRCPVRVRFGKSPQQLIREGGGMQDFADIMKSLSQFQMCCSALCVGCIHLQASCLKSFNRIGSAKI